MVIMPKVVPGYKEAAKSRIIETAFEVFTQKGFDGSTMDDIANKLGVTKGALYQYFKGKDDLLEAIFPMTQRALREATVRSFDGRGLGEGLGTFLDWVEREFSRNYGVFFEWLAGAYRDPRVRVHMQEELQQDLDILAEYVGQRKRKGALQSNTDDRTLAQCLETLLVGAWVRLAMGHNKSDVLRSVKAIGALMEGKR